MIRHKFTADDWKAIKLIYNDDGTRKVYPPRKGVMQAEYYQKSWYKDDFNPHDQMDVWYNNKFPGYDWKKHKAYKLWSDIINPLAKEKYGLVLKDDILYLKKVVGGLMVDETKARTLKAKVKISNLKDKSLKEKLTIIENLFNNK